MQEKTDGHIPIYVSYSTFTTFLDWLAEMPVTPTQLDRSLWGGKFAGGTGSQLMSGLRFLGLVDGETPTDRLEPILRVDSTERKQLLTALLRDAYGADLIDGLNSITPKMLNEGLERLGATDATLRKAFSFIVNAAKANEIPIAPTTAKKARNKPARKAAATRVKPPPAPKAGGTKKLTPKDGGSTTDTTRKVQLMSGGHVTLALDIDLFDLSDGDREFVLRLVDELRNYQSAQQRPAEATDGENEEASGLQASAAAPDASEGGIVR